MPRCRGPGGGSASPPASASKRASASASLSGSHTAIARAVAAARIALGAVGQQLRVALVETRDGRRRAIGGEDLRAAAETVFIDLEELERLVLVCADVVAASWKYHPRRSGGGREEGTRRASRAARPRSRAASIGTGAAWKRCTRRVRTWIPSDDRFPGGPHGRPRRAHRSRVRRQRQRSWPHRGRRVRSHATPASTTAARVTTGSGRAASALAFGLADRHPGACSARARRAASRPSPPTARSRDAPRRRPRRRGRRRAAPRRARGARRRGRAARRSRRRSRRPPARARPRRRARRAAPAPRRARRATRSRPCRSSPASTSLSCDSASASAARSCASSARAEQRRGARRVDAEAEIAQPVVGAAQARSAAAASPSSSSMRPAKTSASSSRCVMPSSSTILRADAIMRRAASVRPRSASSTPWHASATASTAGAPCVMRSTRTTSRQRPLARVTGLGPHSAASGATASTALARRRSPARRAAASARSSAASQAPTLPSRASAGAWTKCAFASPAASPSAASSSAAAATASAVACSACGAVSTVSWPAKQVCQARDAGRGWSRRRRGDGIADPFPNACPREAPQLVDRRRRWTDVAGGEQRLAPVEREIGARGIVAVEAIDARGRADPPRAADRRARARGGRRRRGGARRARRARVPCASSGPSSRRCWCACSRCQPIVSSCSMRVADLRLDPVGERSCSSARVPLSRRR